MRAASMLQFAALNLCEEDPMKIRDLAMIVVAVGALAACARSKAPGTSPHDMTAEQHRAQCAQHLKTAAAYEARADKLDNGKGTYPAEVERAKHADAAAQHLAAAKALEPDSDCVAQHSP